MIRVCVCWQQSATETNAKSGRFRSPSRTRHHRRLQSRSSISTRASVCVRRTEVSQVSNNNAKQTFSDSVDSPVFLCIFYWPKCGRCYRITIRTQTEWAHRASRLFSTQPHFGPTQNMINSIQYFRCANTKKKKFARFFDAISGCFTGGMKTNTHQTDVSENYLCQRAETYTLIAHSTQPQHKVFECQGGSPHR